MHRARVDRRVRLRKAGPKVSGSRHVARVALACLLFSTTLGADAASAQRALASEPREATALRPSDDRWRARGVAFVELPMGLRARYEAQALHRLTPHPELTTPFAELSAGATRRSARLIESRIALSRAVAPHLELELAWTARSPLSMVDLLRIEDQRVAAMIRFVP
jgi:hypothetical protein